MSSSNNNKKNNDDGQGKKIEPTDTFDEKKPPALLTHCDEEALTFTVKKHLNAERSRAKMQMEKKLTPTSSEKNDHDSSRYAISANMSKSDILTLQALQNSMDQSSYAVAASPATAGQYHSQPFAEVAKEEELEGITLLEYLAAVPKVSKLSFEYSNETNIPKAAKGEQQDQKTKTLHNIPVVPHEDNHAVGYFVTDISSIVPAPENVATPPSPQQTLPGAFPVQGLVTTSQNNSYVNDNVAIDTNDGQLEHTTLFNAELVVDPELARASVVDIEAEEKAQCKRQVRTALVLFLVIGLLVTIIATPIQLTRPEQTPNPTLAPTGSPTTSNIPTMTPTDIPTQSPSSNLFGYLADNAFDDGAALETAGTSQNRAMLWLETDLIPRLESTEIDFNLLQFYVLVVIYFEAFGKTWLSTLSQSNTYEKWLEPNEYGNYNFCDWKGIGCNGTFITSLQLSGEGLVGSIPPEVAVLSERLNHIDLSNNTIFNLPLSFSHLSNIEYLNCSANFIEELPSIFGNLTNLFVMDFGDNVLLSGNISSNWPQLTKLRHLNFGHGDHQIRNGNDLTGKIPTELGLLSSLTFLTLGPNRLTGTLPTEIGLLTSLTDLRLYFNTFTGTLPTEIGLLTSLTDLDFSGNTFTGTLPTEIGLLTRLTDLYLSSNAFTDTLPTEIGLLTSLDILDLSDNTFNGTLPTEIGLLTSLDILDLSDNTFTGTLPTEIGLLTSLDILDLSVNTFNGTLPTEIGLLTSLNYLVLSFNTFAGTLRTEIGLLTSLMDLDLSSNAFTDTLPTEIGLLTCLNYLDLSDNTFNGTLPTEIGLLTSLNYPEAFNGSVTQVC